MTRKQKSTARLALMIPLALALSSPLTACTAVSVIPMDPDDQCDHPDKPSPPYVDETAALIITEQAEVIDKCRAILHPERKGFAAGLIDSIKSNF